MDKHKLIKSVKSIIKYNYHESNDLFNYIHFCCLKENRG